PGRTGQRIVSLVVERAHRNSRAAAKQFDHHDLRPRCALGIDLFLQCRSQTVALSTVNRRDAAEGGEARGASVLVPKLTSGAGDAVGSFPVSNLVVDGQRVVKIA